ncbi:MAG: hypothetical protein Ct9H90mP6_00070 [Gammaproteobacteria bacterium]|nr:MAG: hypothetical protein Ct9H90mP6_00070 [Gammaproteobacteria bacterium]
MIRLSKWATIPSNVKVTAKIIEKLKELNYQFLDLEEESIVCETRA